MIFSEWKKLEYTNKMWYFPSLKPYEHPLSVGAIVQLFRTLSRATYLIRRWYQTYNTNYAKRNDKADSMVLVFLSLCTFSSLNFNKVLYNLNYLYTFDEFYKITVTIYIYFILFYYIICRFEVVFSRNELSSNQSALFPNLVPLYRPLFGSPVSSWSGYKVISLRCEIPATWTGFVEIIVRNSNGSRRWKFFHTGCARTAAVAYRPWRVLDSRLLLRAIIAKYRRALSAPDAVILA